ncbi:serine/threonine protein kinase, partial [Pyxidicoccus sp. 3LG]
ALPEAHLALARAEQLALRMGLTGGGDVQLPVTRALESLDRVLTLSPDHARAHVLRAAHHRRLAEHRTRQGEDAEPALQEALAAAKRATALEPASGTAWHEQGLVLWQWARYREGRGEDPRELLRQTLESFERVDAGARGYEFHSNLGLVFKIWADHEEEAGEDSRAHRDQAVEAFVAATRLDASVTGLWVNLGSAYLKRAATPRAADVAGDLARAAEALEKARALNPRHLVAWFNEGQLQEFRARWLRYRGEDARPALEAALAAHRNALALDDKVPQVHLGLGLVHVEQARDAWARGEDPLPLLDLARGAFDRALEVAPKQAEAHGHLAVAHVLRATYLQERGGDPEADAIAALHAARAARERRPADVSALVQEGRAQQVLAAHDLARGRDSRPALAMAEAALRRALQGSARRAEVWHALALVHGVGARGYARDDPRGAARFDEAERAWRKAIELSAWPLDERLAFARACQEWAVARRRSGHEPQAMLRLGLTLTDEVLAARPGSPEARSLRASLMRALDE